MSEHTTTTTSSTSTRRLHDEARDLLKRLRIDHPGADRSTLVKLYVKEVMPLVDPTDEVQTLILNPLREWVGAQIIERRQTDPKTRAERAAAKAALVAEITERGEKRIEEIVTRRLLEYEMIDGRPLGDLTGAECRNLSERYGVFFHVISDQIPRRAKVRNHFTELELQALARHHKLVVP